MTIDHSLIGYFIVVLFPFLGLLINFLFFKKNEFRGSWIATLGTWLGFIALTICWLIGLPFIYKKEFLGFISNELSWLIATLVLFISGTVHHFSLRYMAGDRQYRSYFLYLTTMTISILLMVAADNIILFMIFWSISNAILVLFMMYKREWKAARNSGIFAFKTFFLGFLFLIMGCWMLCDISNSYSIYRITEMKEAFSGIEGTTALLFVMLAAFTQSGIWPFHRWLLSSLNSPTPASAFMHAVLVNSGGLLIVRFAPLYANQAFILNGLFLFGLITFLLGTIWKLMQNDIKRMLACSTISQIGFVIFQCGLGLFPFAIAHLCWHSLFKASLFLRAGSALEENQTTKKEEKTTSVAIFTLACLVGLTSAYGFEIASQIPLTFNQTTLILTGLVWIAGAQFAETLLENRCSFLRFLAAILSCFTLGILYGISIHLIEQILLPLSISFPQPLNTLHILASVCILLIWLGMNFKSLFYKIYVIWWRRLYVVMLNQSQPDQKTITSNRKQYVC